MSPALGLAWANQVMVRLMMRRLRGTVAQGDQCSALRRLEVVFAPHLARDGRDAAVWTEGVRGVMNSESCSIMRAHVTNQTGCSASVLELQKTMKGHEANVSSESVLFQKDKLNQ